MIYAAAFDEATSRLSSGTHEPQAAAAKEDKEDDEDR